MYSLESKSRERCVLFSNTSSPIAERQSRAVGTSAISPQRHYYADGHFHLDSKSDSFEKGVTAVYGLFPPYKLLNAVQ